MTNYIFLLSLLSHNFLMFHHSYIYNLFSAPCNNAGHEEQSKPYYNSINTKLKTFFNLQCLKQVSFCSQYNSFYFLCFLCVCLCQCCISNTDKTNKIARVRFSGSSGGFGVCLFIFVIKSQAQQGKWKPYSLDKMICWFDMSSGPHKMHMTPTYLKAGAAKLAATLAFRLTYKSASIHGWHHRQSQEENWL